MEGLSQVEKTVLDLVNKCKASSADTQKIAEICKITYIQAVVAVQLLKHKNLIVGSTTATDSLLQ
jgi:hypothetical protein